MLANSYILYIYIYIYKHKGTMLWISEMPIWIENSNVWNALRLKKGSKISWNVDKINDKYLWGHSSGDNPTSECKSVFF